MFSIFIFTDKVSDTIATKQTEEQIYLQTDRTFYKPGEDIWFSAWTVERDDHKSSEISDIIYVDLINPKGKIEKSLRLLAPEGRASGDFHFSDESPGGIYKLRAYSLWMKNIAEDNYFEKEITVQKVMLPNLLMKLKFLDKGYGAGQEAIAELDIKTLENEPLRDQKLKFEVLLNGKSYKRNSIITDKEGKALINFTLPGKLDSPDGTLNVTIAFQERMESISRTIPITLKDISLSFFPEGGNLVEEVNSRIAFKALDSYGQPSDIEGRILDEENRLITSFKSFHDGMGAFNLKPLNGTKYHAIID